MAILLAFLTNLTLTSFICGFILKLDIKNESIKDMNINKKMLMRVISQEISIYIFISYILKRLTQMNSLSFGLITLERKI